MKVVWSAASVRRLKEAVEYIQAESAARAVTIRRRILETVWRVGQMPYSGRIGRVEGTREAVVSRSPYIVVYQISAQSVEIVGIWHAARLWPESF
ncbi:MAG: type II toxin-antitoxin system RelE/ParE family toxin [Terracidiphilus sp.]|jgi:toxin ParE1/3/4